MPLLSRNSGRLLRTVGNKAHATQNDHHDALPTPPLSATRSLESNGELKEEAIYADPDSSEDEVQSATVSWTKPAAAPTATFAKSKGFKIPKCETLTPDTNGPARFQPPKFASPGSNTSKRSADEASSGSDDPLFSSQAQSFSQKRHRKQFGSSSTNIHAVSGARPNSQLKCYGQAAKKSVSKEAVKRPGFHPPKKAQEKSEEKDARPKFQVPQGTDIFAFGGKAGGFLHPGDSPDAVDAAEDDRNSSSPSLSSLSSGPPSPEVEEIAALNLPPPVPYVAKVDCPICGQQIPKSVKDDFEDEHTGGEQMSFKWQQRFCRHHQKETAKEQWRVRGYPDIDWEGLGVRLRDHHSHLERILNGSIKSNFEDRMAKRVEKQSRTGMRRFRDKPGNKTGTAVGYYGPKGEKIMTEHILQHMHSQLREWASSNKLVAASGLAGGVSGFVQAALVPELAMRLISENQDVNTAQAKVIMAESAELGELLHPEVVERVAVSAEDDEVKETGVV